MIDLKEIANKQVSVDITNINSITIFGDTKEENVKISYADKRKSKLDIKQFIIDLKQAEIETIKEEKLSEIDEKIAELYSGAIGMILGLKGSREYVQTQKELYENLYNATLSKDPQTLGLLDINRRLFNSQNNQNLTSAQYNTVVQGKWLQGVAGLENFKAMIEIVRKVWRGHISDNVKLHSLEQEVSKIKDDVALTELQTIFSNILAI